MPGSLLPTKDGITVTPSVWLALVREFSAIDQAFEDGKKSSLIRGFSIAFLSLIGAQTVPGSPQFGIRRTSRSHYRFSSSLKGPHNGSLKIQSPQFGIYHTSRTHYRISIVEGATPAP
ncbi:hypothetical protein TNCV_3800011 [Trichonephila clavipes]|nr:hypothetical protein TNCV_3800011 [Trichonephila clavipes]